MSNETILRAQQNCCRLCLAPDSECVPIFNSFAADKEPLAIKIQSCVNIKILPNDRLSSRICHACISYLNSWQSFKNRCIASQTKQNVWLGVSKKPVLAVNRTGINLSVSQHTGPHTKSPPENLKIKEELIDDGENTDIDPTTFLEGSSQENGTKTDVAVGGTPPPQILTSLGLTQSISGVNPFSFLSTELFEENQSENNDSAMMDTENTLDSFTDTSNVEIKEAACRVCSLKFSTRANARRHERKLHPQLFINSSLPDISIQAIKPYTQPTASVSKSKGPITPEMLGIYDYNKPEKYRNLLTEENITFIQIHEEFLIQYQNMTCKCCSKTFATYKNFMAHMRKKYTLLPRNLCFKCLKQNESKALFISHLKKRNCINLYKVYLADTTVDKTKRPIPPSPESYEKLRLKELMSNKIYECKICTQNFRLKLEFRTHVYEEHSDSQKKDVLPGQCAFCGLEMEDPFEAKRHYNNMECIVTLNCTTCEDKFDSHQNFLDHVYAKHLINNNDVQKGSLMKETDLQIGGGMAGVAGAPRPQFSSRLPQSCKICGQRYNNYNNVLRHMESKHPDQLPETYKCTKCEAGYPRMTNLRDHMMEVHGMKTDKYRHSSSGPLDIDGSPNKSSDVKPYTGRYDYVMKDLLSITNGSIDGNATEQTDDGQLTSPEAKKIKLDATAVPLAAMKECHICHAVFSNNIGLSNHMRSHATPDDPKDHENSQIEKNFTSIQPSSVSQSHADAAAPDQRFRRMRCRICQKRFSSKVSYRRHMLMDHLIKNVQFIKCKLCSAEFAYEKGLKVHMFKVHNTVLNDEMIVKQFECDICSTVYRTEEQLTFHRNSVHGTEVRQIEEKLLAAQKSTSEETPMYWYQCRYCAANFNTNKKLAIHINSHNEFDSSDYSCKDCGNVYSGRKSLWVHRYKKHPPIADPSPCTLCNKTFFDKQMLENHTPTCKIQGGECSTTGPFKHRTGDDDDDNESDDNDDDDQSSSLQLPEVVCTMCGKKFTDQELFSKHIEMHEMEMYTDNPLAAMFDTGGGDPNKSYLEPVNESGEYSCDICAKTFPMLSSLKIHRNWHFRNDNKLADGTKRKRASLSCNYCPSTFMSSNNLKRHMAELHKSEIADFPKPPKIEPETYLQCRKCNIKFETRKLWVEHKIADAKLARPFAPFEWGCDICGSYLSRKERLIHHMMTHIKERNNREDDGYENGFESNSRDSDMSMHQDQENNDDSTEKIKLENDVRKSKDDDDDTDSDSSDTSSTSDSESESTDDENDIPAEKEQDAQKRFSCDLCQVYFGTSHELQRHVTSHFMNIPGSVTLTELPQSLEKTSDESEKEDHVVTMTPI